MEKMIFFSRDILQQIGKFTDYKSFVALLSTCKTYYSKKNYLVPIIYDVIDYTDFKPILDKVNDAMDFMNLYDPQHIKPICQIVPAVNLDNNKKKIYMDCTSTLSFKDDYDNLANNLLNIGFPKYSISQVKSIINSFVICVTITNPMWTEMIGVIHLPFTNTIFKFGDKVEIICRSKEKKFPNDMIIDVLQIVSTYNRTHESILFKKKLVKYGIVTYGVVFCAYLIKKYIFDNNKLL